MGDSIYLRRRGILLNQLHLLQRGVDNDAIRQVDDISLKIEQAHIMGFRTHNCVQGHQSRKAAVLCLLQEGEEARDTTEGAIFVLHMDNLRLGFLNPLQHMIYIVVLVRIKGWHYQEPVLLIGGGGLVTYIRQYNDFGLDIRQRLG
jgi:hypothetical protein